MVIVGMGLAWLGYSFGLWGFTRLKGAPTSFTEMVVPSQWPGWSSITSQFGTCGSTPTTYKPAKVQVPGLPKAPPPPATGIQHIPGTNIPLPWGI